MKVTIRFEGLCGFGLVGGRLLAIMPTSHNHRGVLIVPASCLRIDKTHTPDFIFNHGNGQFAGFKLGSKTLEFSTGTGVAEWAPDERAKRTVDLAEFHAGHEGANGKLKKIGAAVVLPAGTLRALDPLTNFQVRVGDEPRPPKDAGAVQWSGDILGVANDVTLKMGNLQIVLKADKPADLSITNVAPVSVGLEHHFPVYYEIFKTPPVDDDKVSISHDGVDDYDCVPPVPLP
jgi:hypothetical protein